MANWYIIDSENRLINIITADSKEIAELITGYTAIEQTGAFGGSVGDIWIAEASKFKSPFPPFVGWVFDEKLWRYEPPIALPDDGKAYRWDNLTQSWIEIEPVS